jgi:hypothetical protein
MLIRSMNLGPGLNLLDRVFIIVLNLTSWQALPPLNCVLDSTNPHAYERYFIPYPPLNVYFNIEEERGLKLKIMELVKPIT